MQDIYWPMDWHPERKCGVEIDELVESLLSKKENEPWMRSLHLVSLAYLCTLPSHKDINKAKEYLLKAKQTPQIATSVKPFDVTFLVEALEWTLSDPKPPKPEIRSKSSRASMFGAKGWTLISFETSRLDEAEDAFRESIKADTDDEMKLHWYLGLALVNTRQRRLCPLAKVMSNQEVKDRENTKQLYERFREKISNEPNFCSLYTEAIIHSEFASFEQIECHFNWGAEQDCGRIVPELISELEWKKDNEPWLRNLHLISLAYLYTLPLYADLKKSSKCLKSVRPDKSSNDWASFLVKATRLKLKMQTQRSGHDDEFNGDLAELSEIWQDRSVQKGTYCAKGWTLIIFSQSKYYESEAAFRQAEKCSTGNSDLDFLWTYGLSYSKSKARKAHDRKRATPEELELWSKAKEMVQESHSAYPVFLAQYVDAISFTLDYGDKSHELITEAIKLAGTNEKYYLVYCIASNVFRAIRRNLGDSGEHSEKWKELTIQEKSTLKIGKTLTKCQNDAKFLFNRGFFFHSVEKNEFKARKLFEAASQRGSLWAEKWLIVLDEPSQRSSSQNQEKILSRYDSLIASYQLRPSAIAKIRLEQGRFLFQCGRLREGAQCLSSALNPYVYVKKDVALIKGVSKENRKLMKEALERAEQCEKQSYSLWFICTFEDQSRALTLYEKQLRTDIVTASVTGCQLALTCKNTESFTSTNQLSRGNLLRILRLGITATKKYCNAVYPFLITEAADSKTKNMFIGSRDLQSLLKVESLLLVGKDLNEMVSDKQVYKVCAIGLWYYVRENHQLIEKVFRKISSEVFEVLLPRSAILRDDKRSGKLGEYVDRLKTLDWIYRQCGSDIPSSVGNLKSLDETMSFVSEQLGLQYMVRGFPDDKARAEALFKFLPDSVEHKRAMIADSLLHQAENSFHDKKQMLRLLSECARLGCKDSVFKSLQLLTAIAKKTCKSSVLSQSDWIQLHHQCVYELVALLKCLQNSKDSFFIKRRHIFEGGMSGPNSGNQTAGLQEAASKKYDSVLVEILDLLSTSVYPRKDRLTMTQHFVNSLNSPGARQAMEKSIKLTLENSHKVLDHVWNDFKIWAQKNILDKIGDNSVGLLYYPFGHKKDGYKKHGDIRLGFSEYWSKERRICDEAQFKQRLEKIEQETVLANKEANKEGIIEKQSRSSAKAKIDKRNKEKNPPQELTKSIPVGTRFPAIFDENDEICKWMITRESQVADLWLKNWINIVNSDKHELQVSIKDVNEKLQGAWSKNGAPRDAYEMAHRAPEFAEEARLVLLNYQYEHPIKDLFNHPRLPFELSSKGYICRSACEDCAESEDPLQCSGFTIKDFNHKDCSKCELLVRLGDWNVDKDWVRIRARPPNVDGSRCILYDNDKCRRSQCPKAHGDAEKLLWDLEAAGAFRRNKFVSKKSLEELCSQCSSKRDAKIPNRCSKAHDWRPKLFYGGKALEIRRQPHNPHHQDNFYRLCGSLFDGRRCTSNNCWYAHNAIEEMAWMWYQRKEKQK